MPTTIEELQRLIAGLSEVVKGLTLKLGPGGTQVAAITTQQAKEGEPAVPQNPTLPFLLFSCPYLDKILRLKTTFRTSLKDFKTRQFI